MNYVFGLNPFKFKFALGLQEMHLKKWGKIHGGVLRVWDPTTNTKLGFPTHLAHIDGTASLA
jgi:hypothetical protein